MTNDNSGQPRFTVAVQAPRATQQSGGSSFNLAAADYSYEREALDRIEAEIVEIRAETDAEFLEGASTRTRSSRAAGVSTPTSSRASNVPS